MIASISVLLISLSVSATTATAICNTTCHCISNDFGAIVDCSRSLLSVIPPVDMWPPDAMALDLTFNDIAAIDVEMTHDDLQSLKLNNNKIASIEASMFSGLKQLSHLDLSHNIINALVKHTFFGLEELSSLDISYNNIQILEESIFERLFRMENLTLSNNKIFRFSRGHLNRMNELKRLTLSNIAAYSLDAELFHGFDKLEFLDLSKNDFDKVPTDALRSAKNLKELLLSENPIDSLDKKSFLGLSTLEKLELNSMPKLVTIEAETFTPLKSLEVLDIRSCKLLTTIHSDAFSGLFIGPHQPLQEIQLDSNRLTTLSEIPCNNINKLNLQGNPWNCDCRLKWIHACIIPEVYATSFRCALPGKLKYKPVVTTTEEDFICDLQLSDPLAEEVHHNRVVRSLSLALGCVFLIALASMIILLFKWRNIRTWWRNKNNGNGAVYYVRARANPIPDI